MELQFGNVVQIKEFKKEHAKELVKSAIGEVVDLTWQLEHYHDFNERGEAKKWIQKELQDLAYEYGFMPMRRVKINRKCK